MSETGRSGINRAFSWLKKTLQITEKTVAPDALSPIVIPGMDVFGWERLPEISGLASSSNGAASVALIAQPDDVLRLILNASVTHEDNAAAHLVWMTLLTEGVDVGLGIPFLVPITAVDVGVGGGLSGPFFMRPGDELKARCDPVMPGGVSLRIKVRFIDLPFGEYVPHV